MNVSFYTAGGVKLAARLTLPTNSTPVPGVLLMPALLAGDKVVAALAERLAENGIGSLALDFRGTGDSEGEKGWLDPAMRVEDALNAVAWMADCPQLDANRLGAWGHRFSAPVAVALGASEPRIRAMVGSSGPGNGHDFMRSLRNGAEWLATLDRVREDRRQRMLTGHSELVSINEIVPMQAFISRLQAAAPADAPKFMLANIDAIMRFHTEDYARRLAGKPLLLVNGERDEVVSVEDVQKIYAAASGPKQFAILPGLDHAGMEVGVGLEQQLSLALQWFQQHL